MRKRKLKFIIIFILIICFTTFVFANITNLVMVKLNVVISNIDIINMYIGFFVYLCMGDIIFLSFMGNNINNIMELLDNKELFLSKLHKYQKEFNLCYLILVIGLLVACFTPYLPLYCLFLMLGLSIVISLQIMLIVMKYVIVL